MTPLRARTGTGEGVRESFENFIGAEHPGAERSGLRGQPRQGRADEFQEPRGGCASRGEDLGEQSVGKALVGGGGERGRPHRAWQEGHPPGLLEGTWAGLACQRVAFCPCNYHSSPWGLSPHQGSVTGWAVSGGQQGSRQAHSPSDAGKANGCPAVDEVT